MNINKYLFLLIAFIGATATSAVAANDEHRSTAKINVSGVKANRWIVEAIPFSPLGETTRKDTLSLVDGALSYSIESDTLFKAFFYPENDDDDAALYKSIELYMEDGATMTVNATLGSDYTDYSVSGSPLSAIFASHVSAYRKANAARLSQIAAKFKSGADSTELATLNREYMAVGEAHINDCLDYAHQHPNEQVAAAYLLEYGSGSIVAAEAERLSPEVRNGQFKAAIDGVVKVYTIQNGVRDNKNNVRIGALAPDFNYTTIDGKPVSLATFAKQNKYVILDFWGSWCAWCIRGVPKMREYRDKYASRLEILGVDCQDKPERMKAAIEKNNINWMHIVNDTSTLDGNMMVKYAVQAFPTKIIVSPEGKIVGYVEGEEESFYETIDEIMK